MVFFSKRKNFDEQKRRKQQGTPCWNLKNILPCLLSAGLLILAYPLFDIWIFAWIALVPMMRAFEGKNPREGFCVGYIWGILFFSGIFYWFIHTSESAGIPFVLSLLGVVLLVLYLALYFGLFGFGYAWGREKSKIEKLFLYPSLWVALEFMRDRLFSGFGWASLGHSQYKFLPVIQIADITGVFGVSFLMVMVNFVIKEILSPLPCLPHRGEGKIEEIPRWGKGKRQELFVIPTILMGLTLAYGFFILSSPLPKAEWRVAIIQGNILQELKWSPAHGPWIMKKYFALTAEAAKQKPDVIIWPETAFPGFLSEEPERYAQFKSFVQGLGIPLLFGAARQIDQEYLNSAIMLAGSGDVFLEHDKMHLVPFGEFLPLRKQIPLLSAIVPIGDFTPGRRWTLFPTIDDKDTGDRRKYFAALICFEDTVAPLTRSFVRKGAQALVNITNDAWFLDTKAPFLHMQAALFRAIENRRSLIRVANTGVSCFINPHGRVEHAIENDRGKKTYVEGIDIRSVVIENTKTFYTKFGDIFAYLCFGCILWTFFRRSKT